MINGRLREEDVLAFADVVHEAARLARTEPRRFARIVFDHAGVSARFELPHRATPFV
jgi:hypothetical protein